MILGPLAEAQMRNALSIGEGSWRCSCSGPMSLTLSVVQNTQMHKVLETGKPILIDLLIQPGRHLRGQPDSTCCDADGRGDWRAGHCPVRPARDQSSSR
jgi:hypothetical protein